MAKDKTKQAIEWFIGKARTGAGYRRNILSNTERSRDIPTIGRMYFFAYDPKLKSVLPVYDKYPLVFPLQPYSDGFLGLNVHYLGISERQALLGKLIEYSSSQKITPTMKLKLSYDLLQSTRSLTGLSRPCIKRYLFNHMRSSFIEITADEWDKVIELPIELFVYKR